MARKKKGKSGLPPRRKRFKRAQRLQSAKAWLETYEGQKIVRDYRRRYGVDWQTAFTELEMLEVPIDPDYKKRVLQAEQARLAAKKQRKAERINTLVPARLHWFRCRRYAGNSHPARRRPSCLGAGGVPAL